MYDIRNELGLAAAPFGDPELTLGDIRARVRRRATRKRVSAIATSGVVTIAAGAFLILPLLGSDGSSALDDGADLIAYTVIDRGGPVQLRIAGAGAVEGVVPIGPAAAGGTWSPDGGTLVFAGTASDGDPSAIDLWIVGADGGRARRLTHGAGVDAGPDFDPTGERVLFTRRVEGERPSLQILDVATGSTTAIPVPGVIMETHWSADGRSAIVMVHSGHEGDPNRLLIVSLDEGDIQTLFRGSFNEPAVSPDGAWVAISSEGRLLLISTDGSDEQRSIASLDGQGLSHVVWGSAGSILFTVPIDPNSGEELRMIDPSTEERRLLAEGLGWRGAAPTWSPDGTAIAFERLGDIWTIDAQTRDVRKVTETGLQESAPSWGAGPR